MIFLVGCCVMLSGEFPRTTAIQMNEYLNWEKEKSRRQWK